MTDNRPGSLRVWTKNPDYYVRGRPLPNSIEHAIVPEYASRLAQFRAGTIWPSVAGQDDIVAMKRELPQTVLRKSDTFSTTPSSLAFGYDGDAPWKDERLRQAVAMLIDREALIDLNTGHTGFREEGLNLDIRYHSVVGAGWEGYWIDPTDEKRFGDNARFFKYNPAEARRLISAAGLPDGFDTLLHYNGGSQYGPVYTRTAEIVSGMLSAGGIRARLDPRDYGDWLPNYHYAYTAAQNAGKPVRGFSGICYRVANSYPTVATQLFSTLHKDGARFEGMTPDGKNPQLGDPDVNQMLFAIRREFDVSKQQVLVQDFARFMARKAYDIPNLPFSALSYSLSWPVIGNLGVYRGWPAGTPVTETSIHLWVDETQPPLSRPA
jgi:ABC-type transport system substrate-binding protein